MRKFISALTAAGFLFAANPALAGPLLSDGQTVVASFTSGKLKGKTFRLKFNERKNKLKDRPVTEHTKSMISIKTPGGWCKFAASGVATCHNGEGAWKAK